MCIRDRYNIDKLLWSDETMLMNDKMLTTRQKQILEYIRECVHKFGYPPSVREICKEVGLSSTSTVHGYLNRLEEQGFIRRDPSKNRTIELLRCV